MHSVFMVKYPKYDDPELKAELEKAYNEIQDFDHKISQIKQDLTLAKKHKNILKRNLDLLWEVRKDLEQLLNKNKILMKPLHDALCKIGRSYTTARACSAEEQLNDVIKILESRMTHETIHLSEEKQIVQEIDKLRGMKSKFIASDARRAEIQDDIANRVNLDPGDKEKLMGTEMDIVSKELQLFKEHIRQDTVQKKYLAKYVETSDAELKILEEERRKAGVKAQELKKNMSAPHENNCNLLEDAKKLAAERNAKALRVLANSELSKDGRQRNPNEKSVVVWETTEMVMKPTEISSSSEASSNEETVEFDEKITEAEEKRKETKRALQIATNKLAMLIKEEKAEKRIARAAIRAEKEAEEQQKIRDKRARRKARKKAAFNEISSEGMEFDQQSNAEMEQQVNPVKQVRAEGSIPKIILKRKKARKFWAWAARAAFFSAVVIVLIACCYLPIFFEKLKG